MSKILKIEFLYRDFANYKTRLEKVINSKVHPRIEKYKVGDIILMDHDGSPTEKEVYAQMEGGYDPNLDHSELEIETITVLEETPEIDELEQLDTGKIYSGHDDLQEGMYLAMFHGRNAPDENLEDWGFNGPVLGPLKWHHTTYFNHIRVGTEKFPDGIDLKFHEDMLTYKGKFYGDWTVFHHKPKKK